MEPPPSEVLAARQRLDEALGDLERVADAYVRSLESDIQLTEAKSGSLLTEPQPVGAPRTHTQSSPEGVPASQETVKANPGVKTGVVPVLVRPQTHQDTRTAPPKSSGWRRLFDGVRAIWDRIAKKRQ